MPRQFGVPEDVVQDVMKGARKPSAYSPYLAPLHNEHVIGVNNAYQIGTWIDVLFFGDGAWHLAHRQALASWPGLKVTCAPKFENLKREHMEGIKYLAKDKSHRRGISSDPATVSWNNNSGAAAISLAVHFGAKRIILLGFDMRLDDKDISHWHGSHSQSNVRKKGGRDKKEKIFVRHRAGFAQISEDAQTMDVEILNASPDSAIMELPKMPVSELLVLENQCV